MVTSEFRRCWRDGGWGEREQDYTAHHQASISPAVLKSFVRVSGVGCAAEYRQFMFHAAYLTMCFGAPMSQCELQLG